jgi:hypothetical protein
MRALSLAALALLALPAGGVAASATPRVRISNETTVTWWAHPASAGPIRAAPSPRARTVGSLHYLTEDSFLEVYVVLERTYDRADHEWLEIRIPRRPNGSTGWVRARELGALHRNTEHLVIDERALTATLYRAGREIFSAPVGVGKPSTPTPTGEFWIREKIVALGGGDPVYGPFALGTSDYSVLSDWPGGGVIGIHGTNEPWLVPGRPSHGCIRMHNADIARLYPLIDLGTPITVR